MKHLLLLTLMALAATLAACSGSSPTGPTTTDSGSSHYYPLAKGNTWTYTGPQNYTIAVVGDTVIGGKTYWTAINSQGPTTGFMRFDGTSYYERVAQFASGETIGLKEGVPVGTTWTDSAYGGGALNRYTTTIAEAGLTRTVLDTTYTDVIHVHLIDELVYNGQVVTTMETDAYYAKGVGRIEQDNGAQGDYKLKSYSVQ